MFVSCIPSANREQARNQSLNEYVEREREEENRKIGKREFPPNIDHKVNETWELGCNHSFTDLLTWKSERLIRDQRRQSALGVLNLGRVEPTPGVNNALNIRVERDQWSHSQGLLSCRSDSEAEFWWVPLHKSLAALGLSFFHRKARRQNEVAEVFSDPLRLLEHTSQEAEDQLTLLRCGGCLRHTPPHEGRGLGERLYLPASSFHLWRQLLKWIWCRRVWGQLFPPRRQTLAWDSKCRPRHLHQIHLLGSESIFRFLGSTPRPAESGTRGVGWIFAR